MDDLAPNPITPNPPADEMATLIGEAEALIAAAQARDAARLASPPTDVVPVMPPAPGA